MARVAHNQTKTGLRLACAAGVLAVLAAGQPVAASDVSTNLMSRYQLMTISQRANSLHALSSFSTALFQGMDLGQWKNVTRLAMMPDFAVELGYRQYDLGLLAGRESLFQPDFVIPMGLYRGNSNLTLDFSNVTVPQAPFLSRSDNELLFGNSSRSPDDHVCTRLPNSLW